jgi:predicted permease
MILGAFLHSLECILILALLCDAGYVTAARGWYDKNSPTLLARLVTFLSLPAYLFSSVLRTLDHDKLLSLLGSMAVPFISVWTCFLISLVIVKVFKVESVHRGVFCSAFTATNNMFIGLPVSLALFGEEAMVPTLLYFFANTTFFWTAGNYLESTDGALITRRSREKLLSLTTLKRVFSPPLCGFLAAVFCIVINWEPPKFITEAARYMGGITTPLALIFIGIMLHSIGIRNIRLSRDMLLVFAGRFLICPAVCLALTMIAGLPPLFAKVYVIQASLPCITQIAVLAEFHHADVKFSTAAVAGTTMFSAVTLPLWMILLTAVIKG